LVLSDMQRDRALISGDVYPSRHKLPFWKEFFESQNGQPTLDQRHTVVYQLPSSGSC